MIVLVPPAGVCLTFPIILSWSSMEAMTTGDGLEVVA